MDRGAPTAALEPSPARQEVIANRLGGASLFLGCIGSDYQGSPFDVIFLFEVIEHVPDDNLADTFALIQLLLAPNGYLIITTPSNKDLELASAVDPRIPARDEVAAATQTGFGFVDDWSQAPVVIGASITLQLPQCPMLSRKADLSPPAPQKEASNSPRILTLDCEAMQHNDENCWTIELDGIASGDSEEKPFASMLELYEDYLPLGPRHAQHYGIRRHGRGRFSHWGFNPFLLLVR